MNFSVIPVLLIISSLVLGSARKIDVFGSFKQGVAEGAKIIYSIFPTMIALIFAVTMLRESGFFEILSKLMAPVLDKAGIPSEIVPLAVLRPFSGSAATALFNSMLQNYGASGKIGTISAVMMGSSETTFYVITVYLGTFGIKADARILVAALFSDLFMVIGSVLFVNLL